MELSCHGNREGGGNSAGSVGCIEEVPSEPNLKRMSRSLLSRVEERENSPGGENRTGVKGSLRAQVKWDMPGRVSLWAEQQR